MIRMNVHPFWLWFVAPWLHLMYAVFWVPPTRDCLLFCSLTSLPRWLGLTQLAAPLLLGRFCVGKLFYVCNFYVDANEGNNVNLQSVLVYVQFIMNGWFMDQLLKWLYSHSLTLHLFALLFVCWVIIFLLSQVADTGMWFFFLWTFTKYALLFVFWLWWQVPFEVNHSIQPPAWRLSFLSYLEQHVNMLSLHPWMPDHPLMGDRTTLWLYSPHETALLVADLFVSIFVLHWTSSYWLLSLTLACKHAHDFVGLPTGWCWQLVLVPSLRDEGKEKCPIVNEEIFFEKTSSLPIFLWIFFGWCFWEFVQLIFNMIPLRNELQFPSQDVAAYFDDPPAYLFVIATDHYIAWICCTQDWLSWNIYVIFEKNLCTKDLAAQVPNPRFFFGRPDERLLLYFNY